MFYPDAWRLPASLANGQPWKLSRDELAILEDEEQRSLGADHPQHAMRGGWNDEE
jgi:hypothetical protein